MTNKEFLLKQIKRKKSKRTGLEDMFTAGEQQYIEKAVESWSEAGEKKDERVTSGFLIRTIGQYIKESSMKEKNKEIEEGLKRVEIVENCTLEDGSKSYKVVIYLTDKRTLEEAVDDYVENFSEERVVEVVKNFKGKEVKTEVSSASGSLADD